MERYNRSVSAVTKSSEEELVVLHTSSGNYYTLNHTGRAIWEYCSEPRSTDEIIGFIASAYDIPLERAEKDTVPYLHFLCRENLMEKRTFP